MEGAQGEVDIAHQQNGQKLVQFGEVGFFLGLALLHFLEEHRLNLHQRLLRKSVPLPIFLLLDGYRGHIVEDHGRDFLRYLQIPKALQQKTF